MSERSENEMNQARNLANPEEREFTAAEIDAAVAAAGHFEAKQPAIEEAEVDNPATSPTAQSEDPSRYRHMLSAVEQDAELTRWRNRQAELYSDLAIDDLLDETICQVIRWRDAVVQKRVYGSSLMGPNGNAVALSANNRVVARDRALRAVAADAGGSDGIRNWGSGNSRPSDLLVISPDGEALGRRVKTVVEALRNAQTPCIVVDATVVANSDAFYALLDECDQAGDLFAAGTVIISRLERLPWQPDALGKLRRYLVDLRADGATGFWAVTPEARGSVAVIATYQAASEAGVPQVIRAFFKQRQVLSRSEEHGSEDARSNPPEAAS